MTPPTIEYLRKLLEGPFRSRSVRGQAISDREPPAAAGAQMRPIRHSRPGGEDQRPARPSTSSRSVEAMTTNETFFFRDKVPFDHFRDTIMPELLKARAARRSLRIWCAAGSTGQEPYSLAMCLKEMGAALAGWRVEIVATDLSQEVLEKSEGRHLQPVRGAARAADPVAGQVLQAVGRILGRSIPSCARWCSIASSICCTISPSSARFDVIFCRNVLIYFDQDTKINIFNRLARLMEPTASWCWAPPKRWSGLTDTFKPLPGAARPVPAERRAGGRLRRCQGQPPWRPDIER